MCISDRNKKWEQKVTLALALLRWMFFKKISHTKCSQVIIIPAQYVYFQHSLLTSLYLAMKMYKTL